MKNLAKDIIINDIEEYKETNYRGKAENEDLFHEEDHKLEKLWRIKRIALPNDGERWKIFDDTKIIFILEGSKLNKKERDFLRSLEGLNFLLQVIKMGFHSLTKIKGELKKIMKFKKIKKT